MKHDYVWVSLGMTYTKRHLAVQSDLATSNVDKFIEGLKLNNKGLPVTEDFCSKRLWGSSDRHWYELIQYKPLPPLTEARGYLMVNELAVGIFRRFDLGGGAFYPVSEGVFMPDNKTKIPGNYFTWIYGNTKSAFLEQHSPKARGMSNDAQGNERRGWCELPYLSQMADDDMAVSQAALAGPSMWVDPLLFKSIFLSGPLGDELIAAGLKEAFGLFRCRII